MNKILFLLTLVCLLSSCSKQNKSVQESNNEENKTENIEESVVQEKKGKSDSELLLDKLLLEAYENNDHIKCIEILQSGSDGRTDYLKPDCPILFDICQKYLDNNKRTKEIESLFNFYVENRKEAFEDSIRGVYPTQTVGSYLSRFASIELLRYLVKQEINIFSPEEKNISKELLSDKEMLSYFGTDERNTNGVIYELSGTDRRFPFYSRIYRNRKLVINAEEKKERMELLLDAGADVTAVNSLGGGTIFHSFGWYPFEEDYTGLLDRMTEKGADLFHKSPDGDSCIGIRIGHFALESNTEAYLEYVISRGLNATEEDLYYFLSIWSEYMVSAEITDIKKKRLEKIKRILEKNLNVTAVINSKGGWRIIE